MTKDSTVSITVGTTAGATSSFGTYCSATGGSNGNTSSVNKSTSIAGGVGGTATGGDLNVSGEKGGASIVAYDSTSPAWACILGKGGSSLLGIGGGGGNYYTTSIIGNGYCSGASGNGYGAGGSGAASGSTTGTQGLFSQGIVLIEYI